MRADAAAGAHNYSLRLACRDDGPGTAAGCGGLAAGVESYNLASFVAGRGLVPVRTVGLLPQENRLVVDRVLAATAPAFVRSACVPCRTSPERA